MLLIGARAWPLPQESIFARVFLIAGILRGIYVCSASTPAVPFNITPNNMPPLASGREGVRTERAYSLASSPYEDALEIFVELVPNGRLTPSLFQLRPGDSLLCRKTAKGRFTLDLCSGRSNHLLISTLTGIAPFVSYIRTLYRDWKNGGARIPGNHRLFCLQGASRPFEFGYREELEHNSIEVHWFKYVASVSRPWEDLGWQGERGRVDEGSIPISGSCLQKQRRPISVVTRR